VPVRSTVALAVVPAVVEAAVVGAAVVGGATVVDGIDAVVTAADRAFVGLVELDWLELPHAAIARGSTPSNALITVVRGVIIASSW
jgi:hypothetical protein